MNKLFLELKTIKLYLIDNRKLMIENYQTIKEGSTTIIYIDKYHIDGNSLSIELLNSYQIIISGNIEKIQIL